MGKKLLSIIIPCYNEEKTVETIYVAITDTMDMLPQYDYEILFVNDGSYLTLDSTNQFAKLRKRNEEKNTISSDRE